MVFEYKTLLVDDPRDIDKLLNIQAADRWRLCNITRGIIDRAGYQKDIGLTLFLEREKEIVERRAASKQLERKSA